MDEGATDKEQAVSLSVSAPVFARHQLFVEAAGLISMEFPLAKPAISMGEETVG
jgi:hypothetical protein